MVIVNRKLCLFIFGLSFLWCGNIAYADSLVVAVATKTVITFNAVKGILFIVGGFGLVGITCAAIFGKLNWKWFSALGVGLAIVAAAAAIINYASGDYMDKYSTEVVNDTFAENMSGSSGGYSGGSDGYSGGSSGGSGGGSSGGSGGGSGGGFWDGFWDGFGKGFGFGYGVSSGEGTNFSDLDSKINN